MRFLEWILRWVLTLGAIFLYLLPIYIYREYGVTALSLLGMSLSILLGIISACMALCFSHPQSK